MSVFSVNISGLGKMDQLIRQAEMRLGPAGVRRGLRPAAMIVRKQARDIAPRDTGNFRRTIKVKSIRGKPVVLVAVDRADPRGLRISDAYPGGFPYVNKLVAERLFSMETAADLVRSEMEAAAVEGLEKELKWRF